MSEYEDDPPARVIYVRCDELEMIVEGCLRKVLGERHDEHHNRLDKIFELIDRTSTNAWDTAVKAVVTFLLIALITGTIVTLMLQAKKFF